MAKVTSPSRWKGSSKIGTDTAINRPMIIIHMVVFFISFAPKSSLCRLVCSKVVERLCGCLAE